MRGLYGALPLIFLLSGCSCGGEDGPVVGEDAGPRGDASTRDAGPGARDAGPPDAGPAGDPCGAVTCDLFEFCDEFGMCRAYRGCVASTMCNMGEICRHRFCIPEDADIDGDGDPAGVDCDETNPAIGPSSPEVCNSIDDDCDEMVDEGDPGELCAMDPSGGICQMGVCGCPPGTFDLDRMFMNGCECTAMPALDQGVSCMMPIDLGDVSDVGTTMTVSGNVLPDDREVWYRFRAVDEPDAMCDNFHVRVRFTTNPMDVFTITVFRGDCTMAECMGTEGNDYEWFTDFTDPMTMPATGECPCADRVAGTNQCDDDTAEYFVRVVRMPGSMVTCDSYALEITNGVYDSP